MPSESKNVRQKLNAVMKAVNYVKKDSSVQAGQGSYKAVSHDQVTAITRNEFVDMGISVETSLVEGKTTLIERAKKANGDPQHPIVFYEGVFEVAFVNIDNEADRVVKRVAAHGEDYGDKAPGKAESMAQKRGVMKILQLESGEDDESRIQHDAEPDNSDLLAPFLADIEKASGIKVLDAIWVAYVAASKKGEWRDKETDMKVKEAAGKRKGVLLETAPAEPVKAAGKATKLDLPADPKEAAALLQAEMDKRDLATQP